MAWTFFTKRGAEVDDLTIPTSRPAGTVIMNASISSTPTGWLVCDGAAVSRTTYATLFAVVGTTYGVGDGATTFNLPDLRTRFIVGTSTTKALNSTAGANSHGHVASGSHRHSLPSHTHTLGSHSHVIGPHTHAMWNHYHGNGTYSAAQTGGELVFEGPPDTYSHAVQPHQHAGGAVLGDTGLLFNVANDPIESTGQSTNTSGPAGPFTTDGPFEAAALFTDYSTPTLNTSVDNRPPYKPLSFIIKT